MSSEDAAPQHDPLAEEMDLITFQEADARLYRELANAEELIERLRATDPVDHDEIAAQQGRVEALTRVAQRLRAQRTQPPLS